MNSRIVGTLVLTGVLALSFAGAAVAGPQTAEDVDKAKKAVTAHLEKVKGNYGQVTHVKDEAVERTLPNHLFFAVLYRQYPVGRQPPEGLKASNVFAVDKEGKVTVLTEPKGLEELFKANVTAKEEAKLKDTARTWLRLTQEFVQDGFYEFKLMDDSTKVTEGKAASGLVVVMKGGSGMISATLKFDDKGQLATVEEKVMVREGPRPRCHATKLLDPDPLVRLIVEQDLLIMGRAAKPYLDEQRAKASPELQKAIDCMWERIVKEDR